MSRAWPFRVTNSLNQPIIILNLNVVVVSLETHKRPFEYVHVSCFPLAYSHRKQYLTMFAFILYRPQSLKLVEIKVQNQRHMKSK